MAKTTKIRDWTMTDSGDNEVTLTKGNRLPLIITHEPGMDREVLIEYATTRTMEAEITDAGAEASDALQRAHDRHMAVSRANQQHREQQRQIAAHYDEGGE